jgi:hypothetical protein
VWLLLQASDVEKKLLEDHAAVQSSVVWPAAIDSPLGSLKGFFRTVPWRSRFLIHCAISKTGHLSAIRVKPISILTEATLLYSRLARSML